MIDTDVIIAAIRSRTGASAEILRKALRGECEIGLSVALALEYEAVAKRTEHLIASGLSRGDVEQLIDALTSRAKPIEPWFTWRPQLRDADDEMVLEAAVNGGANAIVTFNRKDFSNAAQRFGVDVLSPSQALETLK